MFNQVGDHQGVLRKSPVHCPTFLACNVPASRCLVTQKEGPLGMTILQWTQTKEEHKWSIMMCQLQGLPQAPKCPMVCVCVCFLRFAGCLSGVLFEGSQSETATSTGLNIRHGQPQKPGHGSLLSEPLSRETNTNMVKLESNFPTRAFSVSWL